MGSWFDAASGYRGPIVLAVLAAALAVPSFADPPAGTSSRGELREQDVPAYESVGPADPRVGRIEIPRVGVSAAILEGVDYKTIRRAVGHFPETPLPHQSGNVALAAHRTTDFFGLRHIRIGDEVAIESAQGSFRYLVEQTMVVNPEDVWVLDPSTDKVLTLVTCYPFDYQGSAPQRFIVRARALAAGAPGPPEAAGGVPPPTTRAEPGKPVQVGEQAAAASGSTGRS